MFKPNATGIEEQNGDLSQAADRAAATAATLAQEVEAGERADELAVSKLAAAIGSGESGEPIRRLAEARDEAQRKLASRRQDLEQAVEAAKAATAKSESARLSAQVASLNEQLAAGAQALEVALRGLAERWTAFEALDTAARALERELVAARRRYKTTLPEPSAGAMDLTGDCYSIAREAGPALAALDEQREEVARPTPPWPSPAPPWLVGGDGARAVRQREALAESEAALAPRRARAQPR